MIDLKTWQPTSSIEQVASAGLLQPDAFVLIWNPCDGHHLYHLPQHSVQRIADEAREGFGTHWCLMPDGPDVSPHTWAKMDTLEDESDRLPFTADVLLWSPSGKHRLSWLSHDGPMAIAEAGRQGLYTAWRQPPEPPAE